MKWTLDRTHSEVSFIARHLMVTKVRGVFRDFDAAIEIDEDDPRRSQVLVTIAAASIDTNTPERDAHLRSADFFDVERFPQIRFVSRQVDRAEGQGFDLVGDLTIRDTTREVTLKGSFEGPITDPWGNHRLGVSLAGEIDREAFGLTWNMALEPGGVLVGRSIKLAVEAEIVASREQQAEAEAAGAVGSAA